MSTPITTSARRMSHCERLPRYIVAVEVSEALENELAAVKINLENCSRSHFEMGELMQARISALESKNLALSESLQGIIDDCGPDLPVWRVDEALSLIFQSNKP